VVDDGDSFEHPPEKPHDPRLGPPRGLSRSGVYEPQSIYPLQGRSLALLQRQRSNV